MNDMELNDFWYVVTGAAIILLAVFEIGDQLRIYIKKIYILIFVPNF